jgi:stearoyl-CoA desaturase (delta-9 desaturase)
MELLTFLDRGLLALPAWQVVLVTVALTHVTIAAVTIFLHRSQTHRALDLHPVAMHFFRFWLWMTTGMVTREWVAVHRKHHAKCETAEDPHSPVFHGLGKVLLGGTELYIAARRDPEVLSRYGRGTPEDWLERNVYSRFEWLGCTFMLFIDFALFGAIGITVWAVQMAWIPFTAAGVINGVGHAKGYRNFDSDDVSTNIVPWGIVIGGEELHNNHHTYPTSAKLSLRWFEFDLSWGYIRALEILGLARVLHRAPVARLAPAPGGAVDFATLQNLIRMRYDLLARYAGEMRRALEEELKRLGLARADRRRFAALRRWLGVDPGALPAAQRQSLQDLLARSLALRTLVEMRSELAAIWQQAAATREEMLAQLQDWVARAEASGNRALEDLAARIRCYAPV